MSLSLKDQYHGAAMIKIAEYPTFKAINAFEPTPGTEILFGVRGEPRYRGLSQVWFEPD